MPTETNHPSAIQELAPKRTSRLFGAGAKDFLAVGFCAALLCFLAMPVLKHLAGDADIIPFADGASAFLHQALMATVRSHDAWGTSKSP